ncbi:MAG: 1,2-phenylacetyl-CoA epoxidase subunit PaaC, partial [Pseudomonadota bacterium]
RVRCRRPDESATGGRGAGDSGFPCQFLFESFYALQLEQLRASSEPRLAAIAERTGKEIRYHLRHARQWLIRLGDGTEESQRRVQRAVDELWMYTGEMFSRDDADDAAIEAGLIGDPAALRDPWDRAVGDALAEATLARPDDAWMAAGGKQGRHSEHLGYLLADLQFLQRAYPGASW